MFQLRAIDDDGQVEGCGAGEDEGRRQPEREEVPRVAARLEHGEVAPGALQHEGGGPLPR